MQHRVLPIKIPTDLSATFFYALPAACICGDPDYDDWYHMNYLDFYGYKNTVNSAKYEFRFVDAVSYIDRGVHLNEAIELAKMYSDDNVVKMINGDELPISQMKRKKVRKKLEEFIL